MAAKQSPEKKADALLGRFPFTDLAKAVSFSGDRRMRFLKGFITGHPQGSYASFREAAKKVYGAQPPMFELPAEPWEQIDTFIRKRARSTDIADNVDVARCLFDLVRPQGYVASIIPTQSLRVRQRQVVTIGLDYYLTDGERLVFQFANPRRERPSDRQLLVMGSILHHAYAFGEFEEADIEIADLSQIEGQQRAPCIRQVPRADLLDLTTLQAEISEVYAALRALAMSNLGPEA